MEVAKALTTYKLLTLLYTAYTAFTVAIMPIAWFHSEGLNLFFAFLIVNILFVCMFVSHECPREMQAVVFCLFGPVVVGWGEAGGRVLPLLLIARIILEKLTWQSGQKDGRDEQQWRAGEVAWFYHYRLESSQTNTNTLINKNNNQNTKTTKDWLILTKMKWMLNYLCKFEWQSVCGWIQFFC